NFEADSGRAVRIDAATTAAGAFALLALHEPGGQPFRDIPMVPIGHAQDPVPVLGIDASDVRPGLYQLVAVAPPGNGAALRARILHSPLRLGATLRGDSLLVSATGLDSLPVSATL